MALTRLVEHLLKQKLYCFDHHTKNDLCYNIHEPEPVKQAFQNEQPEQCFVHRLI